MIEKKNVMGKGDVAIDLSQSNKLKEVMYMYFKCNA